MAEQALKPIDGFRQSLEKLAPQIATLLPKSIPPQRFIRVVLTAIQNNPALLDADRNSLYAACLQAAQDGLLPDGREGAIISFGGKGGPKAKWMPMVFGIVKKVKDTGEIKTINAEVVYSGDKYRRWTDDTGDHFSHERVYVDRGDPILTYAYAIKNDGGFYFEEIDETQMQAIKNTSRSKDSGPWNGPFIDEMRRKSAIKRLAKYRIPLSSAADDIIQRDDEDALESVPAVAVQPTPSVEQGKPSRLKAIIGEGALAGSDEPVEEIL